MRLGLGLAPVSIVGAASPQSKVEQGLGTFLGRGGKVAVLQMDDLHVTPLVPEVLRH